MKPLFDKSKFSTKKEMIQFISDNKNQLIAQKKSIIKEAQGFSFVNNISRVYSKNETYKGNSLIKSPADILIVKPVINTTNWFDSHEDVHIKGWLDKNLKEHPNKLHVQEHKSSQFNKIISSGDDLKAYMYNTTWKELGYNISGETQAFMFDSTVRKSRNPYMHEQYSKGYVTNHSVGMQYVKIFFCCNDKDFEQDYQMYLKYIGDVANKKDVEETGYFWAVVEGKAIEGSAVPTGSNPMTPTIENNAEPQKALRTTEPQKALDINKLINLM